MDENNELSCLISQPQQQIVVRFKERSVIVHDLYEVIINKKYSFYIQCTRCQRMKRFIHPCVATSRHNIGYYPDSVKKLKQSLIDILNKKTYQKCSNCTKHRK